jgi:hypothetical protein
MEPRTPEGVEAKPRGDRKDYVFQTSGKPAVFLQHGVLASSLDWVLTGPHKALGEWRQVIVLSKLLCMRAPGLAKRGRKGKKMLRGERTDRIS